MSRDDAAMNGKMVWNSNYLWLIVTFIFIVAGYYDVFQWMYGRYVSEDSYYSHGFLVPIVSGYLIWLKRGELAQLPVKGSFSGIFFIVFAILLNIFGTAVYVFSVSAFSMLILIIGISVYLYGKEVTKAILFPLAFLLFMFPLPLSIISMISFPLKMLVAHLGVKIVALLGVPIFREGFHISIPQGELLVGNPCSGLRSIISLLALGSLFGYFCEVSISKKVFLFFMTIPIAIISNLIRVPILILWSFKWGVNSAAPGTFVHTGSGLIVFLLAIVLLVITARCVSCGYEK